MLKELQRSLKPGAPLLLVDYWLNSERTQPPFAAITAAEFLLTTGEGNVYAIDEIQGWMNDIGLEYVEHRPLVGPTSVVVARRL